MTMQEDLTIALSTRIYLRHHPAVPGWRDSWTLSTEPGAERHQVTAGVTWMSGNYDARADAAQIDARSRLARFGLQLRGNWCRSTTGSEWENEIISFDPIVPEVSDDTYEETLKWAKVPFSRDGDHFIINGHRYRIWRHSPTGTLGGSVSYSYQVGLES